MILTLDSKKPIHETTIVVAMSGGVDSSTVAALVKEAGYKVIGVTLRLYNSGGNSTKSCCGDKDVRDAEENRSSYRYSSLYCGFPG